MGPKAEAGTAGEDVNQDPIAALEARQDLIFTGPEGARIAWHCWGEGRPVVFLHGASGSWRHWLRQVEAFGTRGRLICPDLPGFGLSDMPELPLDMTRMVGAVADGLDELIGAETAYDLVAFSYGGSVASHLIRRHSGRQRRVFLCAPAGFGSPSMPPMQKVRGLSGTALTQAHRANLETVMFADPAKIDPLAVTIQTLNSAESRLRPAGVSGQARLQDALAGVGCPVTLVWGTRDAFVSGARIEDRVAQVRTVCPDAQVHLLDGAGHWVAYEAAEAVNARLSEAVFDS